MIFPYDFFCDFSMIFPIYDISEFVYDFYRIKQKSQKNDKKILTNHRKIIDIIEKSQKNPRKAASQFLNPVSINLKKLPQMPASRSLKCTGRNWPNPVCSFYLPVSTSRDDPVYIYVYIYIYIHMYTYIYTYSYVCWLRLYMYIYTYLFDNLRLPMCIQQRYKRSLVEI